MNCFQILYLCHTEPVFPNFFTRDSRLWIAFKFFIFVILNQYRLPIIAKPNCCELLSNSLSLSYWTSFWTLYIRFKVVVNCFQILYLCHTEPVIIITNSAEFCCELLSNSLSLSYWTSCLSFTGAQTLLWIAFKFFIFVILNQFFRQQEGKDKVVNCFQILYLCHTEPVELR